MSVEKSYNNIAIFKNTKGGENPKAPSHNVSIEFADGSKWKGGLWPRTSKTGTTYLSGNLEPIGEFSEEQVAQARKTKLEEDLVDW
jgi:uncharacterized protein (DUF736 family)